MKFVVAGGGVAGLAATLAVAPVGQEVIVLDRHRVDAHESPRGRSMWNVEESLTTFSRTRSRRVAGACC
jgi:2-polyprenyl-6-methoxyphenol hydroxylase-like FAD-dependent oxidoreductase